MCAATALPARPRGSKHMFRTGKQQKEKWLPHSCHPETEASATKINHFEVKDNYFKFCRAGKDEGFCFWVVCFFF